ncbi:MAG TPA: hypothetical protein VER33_27530, partial [Polyangiaceae bacterium]|nr:hypothetical protein [Polyangiaceae bacterium]
SADGALRARVSGTLDLEALAFPQPAPGLIFAQGDTLLAPRLTTFLDGQLGDRVYAFAQMRVDRGFDPGDGPLEVRLDEYAMRFTSSSAGSLNLQAGRFATIVGNWVPRHGSWDNPFVLAPLAYEHLTGIWDSAPASSVATLLGWAHVRPPALPGVPATDKHLRLPIVWGPSYTHGVSASAKVGRFSYAAELKSASLSSRPPVWDDADFAWRQATVSGRVVFQPSPMWQFGWSASTGSYLLPSADATLGRHRQIDDYRQRLIGHDVSFAWHHLQLWAEVFYCRFEVPGVGNPDTLSYYVEAKYKLTPQFFLAARWNEQRFGTVREADGRRTRWGGDVWRAEIAPTYRFTPNWQLKLHYTLAQERGGPRALEHLLAAQLTVRF